MSTHFVLGISCFYHDSAAALIKDGEILAAVQEERFTRIKHDASFPSHSIAWILKEYNLSKEDISEIIYYEKPFITFERLVETHLNYAPFGLKSFLTSVPIWIKEKIFLERDLKKGLLKLGLPIINIKYSEHHLSHAASAFYPSPFERSVVLCVDGVGEWATTSAWLGNGNDLTPLWEIHFPHSIGLLYSALTSYLGFKVNSGEYKVMGLAPYGNPIYSELMLRELVSLHDDGSYSLNMDYFSFGHQLKMYSKKMEDLFGRRARVSESELDPFHMDVAASLQSVLEKVLLHITICLKKKSGENNLCLAGGVALNCVANSKILTESGFERLWIQPAAGDAGGALGAALAYWHIGLNKARTVNDSDSQKGSLLGPEFKDAEIESFLIKNSIPFEKLSQEKMLIKASNYLVDKKIIGWFQGKMEFGPRALGNRSIIGDAKIPDLQKTMNLKIKFRESFRPFAPLVTEEDVDTYFNFKGPSPYMLFVTGLNSKYRLPVDETEKGKFGIDKLNIVRSDFPAITHVDYSARLQTVDKQRHSVLHDLLTEFKLQTGHAVMVNTSFNVRGEPIVCSPEDAYRCFRRTDIDVLILGNFIMTKDSDLPSFSDENWEKEFDLD
jgi:carbamoyltransferase